MRETTRKLIIGTILLSGTQCVNSPYTSFSIFQLCLIVTAVFVIPQLFGKRLWSFPLLWVISSVIAYSTSINPSWAKSYLLLGLMTAFLLLIMPLFFERNDLPLLIKTLIRSQYIVIPFSIINFLFFYNISAGAEKIPLGAGFYINMTTEALDRGTAAGEVRLMLPYATPPVLSIVMTMCITLLLFCEDLFSKKIRICLCLIFGTILIFTGSRSGLAGLAILLMMLLINGDLIKILRKISFKWYIIIIISFILIVGVLLDSTYFQKMIIDRFSNLNNSSFEENRHYLVPLDGLIIWLSSLSNFLVGIGFGSSLYIQGAHTYLPPYFLNSFVTLLVERGLLGLTILLLLLKHLVKIYKIRIYEDNNTKAFIYMILVGMFSGFFYESLNCYFIIFTLSISFLLTKAKS